MRTRIFSDTVDAPGGSLDAADFAGIAANGEVEDYNWVFGPTSVTLTDFSAMNSPSNVLIVVLLGSLVVIVAGAIIKRRIRN